MSGISEIDSTTDHSQSSTDDSGLNTSLEENLTANQAISEFSCSDMLAELFLNRKRLREAETQVRSLSLILQHGNCDDAGTGIDHAVFQENKSSLEDEVMKRRQEICDKELILKQGDVKLYDYYLGSINNEGNSKLTGLDLSQNEGSKINGCGSKTHLNGRVSLPNDLELDTSEYGLENKDQSWDKQEFEYAVKNEIVMNEVLYPPNNVELDIPDFGLENKNNQQYFESSPNKEHEIAKLRRTLTETRQKHNEDRDNITKQLKALQITTVNGETNWRCVMKEKQLKIEELTRKNTELQTKHAELSVSLKNIEKLRQKEAKESERRMKKNAKVISSLRNQNSCSNEEIKQSLCEVEEFRSINQELNASLKQSNERNKELEKCLFEKSETLDEKNKIIQEYSKEIEETNSLINKLIIEMNCVNTDKENLEKQIEELKTENTKNLEQIDGTANSSHEEKLRCENSENGTQTEESTCQLQDELQRLKVELESERKENTHLVEQVHEQKNCLEYLKESESKLQTESATWKNKSFQNERTIQELTISFGKATEANELSCERNIEEYREIHTKNKGKFSDSLVEMLEEVKVELSGVQEDFIKHRENVDSLQKTWRKYKGSMIEMNQN